MSYPALSSCIIKSLRLRQMEPDLPRALLSQDKTRAQNRTENRYWDYKEQLELDDVYQISEFAKDVLAFHNTEGGAIVVGITDKFIAKGISASAILDTRKLRDKVSKYLGDRIELFQESVELLPGKFLWLVFIPKYAIGPKAMEQNGPADRSGRAIFSKGQYFYRDGDAVKVVRHDADMERLYRGFSSEHLTAYPYEVDDPFFRLLSPDFEEFIGREEQKEEIKAKLDLRNPVVALDGPGGVGKTAIAIQAVRELHEEKKYLFIVSISAKSKVWAGHVKPKKAAFAGLHGLLTEIANVIPYIGKSEATDDTLALKAQLIDFMKGEHGLLMVDNLEEISDDSVFKFLCEEVPEPVKVLITSRIDKEFGAKTITIPEMTVGEARQLFEMELAHRGCVSGKDDEKHIQAILDKAGGVPLAIKWAAQIASESGSLEKASSILRGAGPGKRELLNFCFGNIFDALSNTAKDAAKLIPHLGPNWNAIWISTALDISVEEAHSAIGELSAKGIISRGRRDRPNDYYVLPLTEEYLSNKCHESHLARVVDRRIAETFSLEGSQDLSEGFLFERGKDERIRYVTKLAREKIKKDEYAKALRLVRLAESWIEPEDMNEQIVQLRYLEGKTLYMTDNRLAGLAHMERAIGYDAHHSSLLGDEVLFFAQALFAHGGGSKEKLASEAVSAGVDKGGNCTKDLLDRFIDCNIKRSNYKAIADVVSKIRDAEVVCLAFNRIEVLLNNPTIAYPYEKHWATALGTVLASPAIEPETKKRYAEKFGPIREHFFRSGKT